MEIAYMIIRITPRFIRRQKYYFLRHPAFEIAERFVAHLTTRFLQIFEASISEDYISPLGDNEEQTSIILEEPRRIRFAWYLHQASISEDYISPLGDNEEQTLIFEESGARQILSLWFLRG